MWHARLFGENAADRSHCLSALITCLHAARSKARYANWSNLAPNSLLRSLLFYGLYSFFMVRNVCALIRSISFKTHWRCFQNNKGTNFYVNTFYPLLESGLKLIISITMLRCFLFHLIFTALPLIHLPPPSIKGIKNWYEHLLCETDIAGPGILWLSAHWVTARCSRLPVVRQPVLY